MFGCKNLLGVPGVNLKWSMKYDLCALYWSSFAHLQVKYQVFHDTVALSQFVLEQDCNCILNLNQTNLKVQVQNVDLCIVTWRHLSLQSVAQRYNSCTSNDWWLPVAQLDLMQTVLNHILGNANQHSCRWLAKNGFITLQKWKWRQ